MRAARAVGAACLLIAGSAGTAGAASLASRYDALAGSCWGCGFVGRFTEMCDRFAKLGYDTLRVEFGGFLSYLFAIWLCVQAVRLVLPFMADPAKVLGDLVSRSFVFVLAMMMLSDTGGGLFWEFVYKPLMMLPPTLAGGMLQAIDTAASLHVFGTGATCGAYPSLGGTGGVLAAADVKEITCLVEMMQRNAAGGVMAGVGGMEQFHPMDLNLSDLFAGMGLTVLFGIVMLSFPFYFIDIYFRLGLLGALAPIAIVGWVFKPTRGWAKMSFLTAIHAGGVIVAVVLVYALSAIMMKYAAGLYVGGATADMKALLIKLDGAGTGSYLGFYDMAYWFLVFAAFLLLVVSKKLSSIVSSIVGAGSDTGLASAAIGAAGTAVRGAIGITAFLGGSVMAAAAMKVVSKITKS